MMRYKIKLPYPFFWFFLIVFIVAVVSCGSGGGTASSEESIASDIVNTEKLLGTPFEGLTIGDDFDPDYFRCGQYRTDTVVSFPIQIFAAFFTGSEEEIIQEGIDVANEGIGFEAYVLTDTWADDARVIYKVQVMNSANAAGQTYFIYRSFDGASYAENQAVDWSIELDYLWINKWVVAHELGHATGIVSHTLIDYENNELLDLEPNSLMGASGGFYGATALTDYDFMMSMQGQIMQEHLGEEGSFVYSSAACDE